MVGAEEDEDIADEQDIAIAEWVGGGGQTPYLASG
jgi:hypothetical protein